jgi:hypothetical protein
MVAGWTVGAARSWHSGRKQHAALQKVLCLESTGAPAPGLGFERLPGRPECYRASWVGKVQQPASDTVAGWLARECGTE